MLSNINLKFVEMYAPYGRQSLNARKWLRENKYFNWNLNHVLSLEKVKINETAEMYGDVQKCLKKGDMLR